MYVTRSGGKITGVFARPQHKGQEQIDRGAPEVVAFLTAPVDADRDTRKSTRAVLRQKLKDNGTLTQTELNSVILTLLEDDE